jgi:hypothetical protein
MVRMATVIDRPREECESIHNLLCAMKRIDRMGEIPRGSVREPTEPLGLSRIGRSIPVSSMPLKGTREARGKPPRRGAWLRDHMVSSNEVGFNLRGNEPLSQDLARWDSQRAQSVREDHSVLRGSAYWSHCPKDGMGQPDLPHARWGACNSR